MFRMAIRQALLLLIVLSAAACTQQPRLHEVDAISEFDISHRPIQSARQHVEAILATGTGGSDTPMYSDIAFFPVVRPDAFDSTDLPPALRRNEVEPDVSAIDFDHQFGFLVAHPNASKSYRALTSGQHATYFSSVSVSYPEDRVLIHLKASRLGDLDPMTALTARWAGSIYPIDRRGRSQVEVRLDEHSYMYSLQDGELQATASRVMP